MKMKMKLTYFLATLIFCFHDLSGVFGVEAERVFVMDGDSVTLHTGNTSQYEKIMCYFNDTRIALINGDLSKSCTDVECYKGNEIFRHRLKLDHHSGDLTIMNIRTTDHTGNYKLKIYRNSRTDKNIEKIFSFAADSYGMKSLSVKDGECVTLVPGGNAYNEMSWHFNDILIAQITGNQSLICTYAECKERFTDRLKTENGSLRITSCRSTDSGQYKLMINSSSFSIVRRFSVNVTNSTHTEEKLVVIVCTLLAVSGGAVVAVAAVILCRRHHKSSRQNETRTAEHVEMDVVESAALNPGHEAATNETSSNQDNYLSLSSANGNGLTTNGRPH